MRGNTGICREGGDAAVSGGLRAAAGSWVGQPRRSAVFQAAGVGAWAGALTRFGFI